MANILKIFINQLSKLITEESSTTETVAEHNPFLPSICGDVVLRMNAFQQRTIISICFQVSCLGRKSQE